MSSPRAELSGSGRHELEVLDERRRQLPPDWLRPQAGEWRAAPALGGVVFLNNIVTPYTNRLFNAAVAAGVRLTVVSAAAGEPNRGWGALADSGDLRGESNVGKGQMQAADFVMSPNIQIAANNTGGIGGALAGGLLSRVGLGGIAGGLKFKEAQTSLLVSDVRSSIQVASAEGKASKTDFDIGGWGWAGNTFGAMNGYTSTPEGKVIAASLLDNYNHIVIAIRDNASLIKTSSAAGDVNARGSTHAGVPVKEGEVLMARINGVKVFSGPSKSSKVVGTLSRSDELIANGQEQDGFVQVDSSNFSGWVQRSLVGPGGH